MIFIKTLILIFLSSIQKNFKFYNTGNDIYGNFTPQKSDFLPKNAFFSTSFSKTLFRFLILFTISDNGIESCLAIKKRISLNFYLFT